jgi:hypothetical protein
MRHYIGAPVRPAGVISSFAALTLAIACSPKKEEAKAPPRTPEQQRAVDSTIGASALPGARVVRGALAVSDSAAAKRKLEDSLATTP